MPQLSTVAQKGQVTIPAHIRNKWGLRPQKKVAFIELENEIVIKPAVDFFDLKGSIKSKKKYSDKKADRAVGKFLVRQHAKQAGNS